MKPSGASISKFRCGGSREQAGGQISSHLVHLNTGVDALSVQRIDEGSAVGAGLVKGLLEQDGAADVLAEVGSRDEELTVTATVLLVVLDTNTLEARPAGGIGLVHSEDALARHSHLGLHKRLDENT